MAASRKWLFKNKFRARVYGWRGSKPAISRLKEAASEIRSVAKSDPVAAGEGTVSLMERMLARWKNPAPDGNIEGWSDEVVARVPGVRGAASDG